MKYILPTFHCRCQPSYKISSKYLNPRLNFHNFLKFKMAAVCYLGFSVTWFWAIGRLGLRFSIIVPNLVQKYVGRHRNYGPKSKSKMAAVRHLGFVTSSYRTIHEVFSLGYIGIANFMLIRYILLKIWRFDFLQIWLEMPSFMPPKFGFFWESEPLNVIGHHGDPKRHILGRTALTWRFYGYRSSGATWARDEGTKKGKERKLQWQTGCSPRPPTLTQRYVVLHAGWSSGGSYKFQVSSKSAERLSRCGGRNLPFPIPKASGLYNSLYTYKT